MVRIAVVRFSKTSKKYRYIIPDGISVDAGQYVIVPDKISDQRYKTAQCIATECYSKCPDTIYEYIVNVVDDTRYQERKQRLERTNELEDIIEQLEDHAKKYNGFVTVECEVAHEGITANSDFIFTIRLQEPVGTGLEISIDNSDSTLARTILQGEHVYYN